MGKTADDCAVSKSEIILNHRASKNRLIAKSWVIYHLCTYSIAANKLFIGMSHATKIINCNKYLNSHTIGDEDLGGDLLLTIRPLTMVSKMICYKTMSSNNGRQQLVLCTYIHGKLVFVHIFHDVTTIQEDWVDIIELFSATSLVCLCFFYCHVWYRKLIAFIWQDQCSLLFYLFPRQHYFSSFSLLLDLIHSIAIVVPFKNTAQQMLGMSSFLWS